MDSNEFNTLNIAAREAHEGIRVLKAAVMDDREKIRGLTEWTHRAPQWMRQNLDDLAERMRQMSRAREGDREESRLLFLRVLGLTETVEKLTAARGEDSKTIRVLTETVEELTAARGEDSKTIRVLTETVEELTAARAAMKGSNSKSTAARQQPAAAAENTAASKNTAAAAAVPKKKSNSGVAPTGKVLAKFADGEPMIYEDSSDDDSSDDDSLFLAGWQSKKNSEDSVRKSKKNYEGDDDDDDDSITDAEDVENSKFLSILSCRMVTIQITHSRSITTMFLFSLPH